MLGIRYNSPVILTFSLIATLLSVVNFLTNGSITEFIALPASFNASSPVAYLSIFTYVFGHANEAHLLGNLSLLLLIGPILEEKYGSKRILFMFFITTLITALLNLVFFGEGLWGASGIVFMCIILASFTNTQGRGIPLTFIFVILLFLGKEIIESFKPDQVSQFAHIIGGVIGSMFGFVFNSSRKPHIHTRE